MTYGKEDHADRPGLYDLGVPEIYRTTPHDGAAPQDLREVYFDDELRMCDYTIDPQTVEIAGFHRNSDPSKEFSLGDERNDILNTLEHERECIQQRLALMRAARNSFKSNPPTFYQPPASVTRIFRLFISGESCAAIVGDLGERYAKAFKQLGRNRSLLLFWQQVITSLAPFVWAALKRISGLEAIYRLIGR